MQLLDYKANFYVLCEIVQIILIFYSFLNLNLLYSIVMKLLLNLIKLKKMKINRIIFIL